MNSTKSPFIHFHIPKTAGTSLRMSMIQGFSSEGVAFMLPDRTLVRTSDLPFKTDELDKARWEARNAGKLNEFSEHIRKINSAKLSRCFELAELEASGSFVATGHFTHADISETVAHLPRTTILRNPLERMWSHYSHWKEAKGRMWWHLSDIDYTEHVRFEEFAVDHALQNYQAKCLGSLAFEVVGITEKLPEFLGEIGLTVSGEIPVLNPGVQGKLPEFNIEFVEEFRQLHALDYELYEAAASNFT